MTTHQVQTAPVPVPAKIAGPIQPQRFSRMIQVEIRKMLDTRAGVAVVLGSIGVVLIAAVWMIIDGAAPQFDQFGQVLGVAGMLLPIIALLGMTSEWSQRTALTTFTASPRRGRVLSSKIVASLMISAVAFVAMVGVLSLAVVVAGMVNGGDVSFDGFGTLLRAFAIMTLAQVLMAMGFGALLGHTAFAIVLFFLTPTLVPLVAFQLFGENSSWFNVLETYDRLASSDPWSNAGQTIVTLLIWVVLPFTVGIIRSMRREVK